MGSLEADTGFNQSSFFVLRLCDYKVAKFVSLQNLICLIKRRLLTITRNSWVSVKTKCTEFDLNRRDKIQRWFSGKFKLIMMDMLWKLVWLHKRGVLFPLRMSICCYPYRLLLLKKFSSCWFMCWFSFMLKSSFQRKRRRKRNWNFKPSLVFSLTNQLKEQIQYVTMWRHGIVYKDTPHASELQFALSLIVYTWLMSLELKRNSAWNGL